MSDDDEAPDTDRAAGGGDVYFKTGDGQPGEPVGLRDGKPGTMFFHIGKREVMRIEEDGRFYVDGRPVAEDAEVYRAFVRWLAEATAHWGPGAFTVKGQELDDG